MLIDILMRFARLNDPKKSVGKANLSLENLAEDIEDGPLKTRMLEARKRLDGQLTNLKDIRNKVLSHNDLDQKLGRVEAATGIPYAEMKNAAQELAECLNVFHQTLGDTTRMYASCITKDDGDTLHHFLHYGLISRQEDEPEEFRRKELKMWDHHANE